MTIVAARRYSGGKITDAGLKLDGTLREALPPHSFDWVGLAEPDAEEMELVRSQFGLHPLAVEDALTPTQMPKVEVYGPQLFIVVRTADMTNGENIEYGQTALFLGRDFIVSVRFGSSRAHSDLRTRLESNDQRLAEGPDYVAHAILDFVVDGYIPILEKLESAVLGIEERAIDAFPDPITIRRIFRLRRQLRRFLRVVGPTDEMCEKLVLHDYPAIDPSARVWFRDVLDHVRRALRRVGGLIETLASVVETASMLEQHRQGQMTRQLAAWAAILAVPTAIAGIYGMNFDYMPELHHKWGYPVVLTAIFAICGGLFWRFKRIGWL
ncbi:magnesium and cobalt transport protein CorA [Novosphingobium sp. B 225]|uniref:magnesium and cobalt transport protein CorA n=1 Tax=Novosphingobium sp. B 225 TaxID=1961849 RepID=UPI000B4BE037|nr:magnesium and cobalt transport protein CorA [Novosphingobium sp. B 225]